MNTAYNNFVQEVTELQNEEAEVNIDKINTEEFIEAMTEQDIDITPKYLESLTSILSNEFEN